MALYLVVRIVWPIQLFGIFGRMKAMTCQRASKRQWKLATFAARKSR